MFKATRWGRVSGGSVPAGLPLAVGLLGGVLAALAAGPALAVSGTWISTTSGAWGETANWQGSTIATGSSFTATFANNITSDVDVNLDSTRTLSAIVFGDSDTSSAGSWTISGTTLTLQAPLTSGTGATTITVNSLGTGATATISGSLVVTNNGGLFVKNGVGTLVLGGGQSGVNTIAGKTSITAGTLQIGANGQLGATPGSFTADQLTISNGATLRTGSAVTLGQNRGITIGTGGGTLNINGGALAYAGRLTGAGQTATVTGTSAISLTNATGVATNVNWDFALSNSIRAFFAGSDALGTGSVRVRSGVRLTSRNTAPTSGQVTNAVTVETEGGLTAQSTAGAVTYTNVTLPTSGTIKLNFDDQITAALTISSGAVLAGDLAIDSSPNGASAINNVGNVTLSGVFSGTGGLTKSGTGTTGMLILGGANTYTGNTSINSGTLQLSAAGSIASSGTISVASGAWFDVSLVPSGFSLASAQWLQGSGTVLGSVAVQQGTVAPGLSGSAGTLSFANGMSLDSGSLLSYGLTGTSTTVGGGVNDLSAVTGNLTLDGTINVSEIGAGSFLSATQGNTWRLFTYTGSLTNNGLSLGSTPTLSPGLNLAVDTSTAGEVNLIVVPEPAVTVPTLLGLVSVFVVRAKRRRADATQ